MSANAEPQPDRPDTPSLEASTTRSKTIPPRKLARFLLDAARPIYLLDGKGRVRFANRVLVDILKTSESALDGLDCNRALPGDDHPEPRLAGLLAIPASARTSQMSFDPIANSSFSIAPWTSRLVIPLDSQGSQDYVLCVWLRADDPLVVQASNHVEWHARAEIRTALIDARRSNARFDGLHSLIGSSPSAQLARRQTQAAIASNIPVCIYGPIGSGKATLARAIYHQRRKRERRMMSSGRLLSIDCRLMDRSLIQETIELATENESTHRTDVDEEPTALLLAGIDLLASDAFPPLAHLLDHNPTTPVFATSRTDNLLRLRPDPLWQDIVAHIHVMSIHLEPLSSRVEDIAPLTESILEEIRIASPGNVQHFLSSNALSWLQAYPWPNNYRELRHAIQDACIKASSASIEPNHFSLAIRTFPSHVLKPEPAPSIDLDQAIESFERGVLQRAIDAFPRNRAAAARHLGISRTRLLRRLAQLGLETTAQETETAEPHQTPDDTSQAHDQPVFEEIPDEPKS